MDAVQRQMHFLDILIFVATFLLSSAVGIYFAYRDRQKQSIDQYYVAGGNISPFPAAISMAVSFISGITVIGYPVEVYLNGAVFVWILLAQVIGATMSIVYFIPLIHELQLKSLYKFVELRFHRILRTVICVLAMMGQVCYAAMAVYLPSIALSAVTSVEIPWAIAITSIVCTFYTTIGGMKAVIWTDVLQSAFMVGGMLAVFIRAVVVVGGFQEMFSVAHRGGRMNFFEFDVDPRTRSTVWSIVLGLAIYEVKSRSFDQVCVQRYLSCKTIKDARIALFLALNTTLLITLLSVGCGLALYAYYEGCDPLAAKEVKKSDQLMPKLVADIFRDVPGMTGLFVAAAYCGTLSTISSLTNALAALSMLDFVQPCFPNMSSTTTMTLNKLLSASFGILVMLVAYVISASSTNVVSMSVTLLGSISGPIVGLFIMGAFMPWVNSKGALAGILTGWAVIAWIGISALTYGGAKETLPLSIATCNFSSPDGVNMLQASALPAGPENMTKAYPLVNVTAPPSDWGHPNTAGIDVGRPLLYDTLYSISPFNYGVFGFLICAIVGNIVSFTTGIVKPSEANPDLFVPLLSNQLLPKRIIKFFRFGVPEKVSRGNKFPLEGFGEKGGEKLLPVPDPASA